jgi:leucyl-tRNA synthetase
VANYVLGDYGTGAVMGVPAHDIRDFRFSQKYDLPMVTVIEPENPSDAPSDDAYIGSGRLLASAEFTGWDSERAKDGIGRRLAEIGRGGPRVTYRMRDWLISRQRYWGAPIPIIHCPTCGPVPTPADQLPVMLPDNAKFTGRGQSPLAQAEEWVNTVCPRCDGDARRDTDTMDTFVDSSWYYYRYTSASAGDQPFNPAEANYWMPVDEYVGGKEHAVLHLLYSRFFTKVLHDVGLVEVDEPFRRLLPQGMVVYQGEKMSKSKGNALSPESILAQWGSDATRVFILFAAPPDKDFEWSERGVEGAYRFLQRVYRLVVRSDQSLAKPEAKSDELVARMRARTVHKVTEDLDRRAFNTAVSAMMEYTNALYQEWPDVGQATRQDAVETLAQLLAPFAPHISEELWHELGHRESVHLEPWPGYDPALLVDPEVEVAIQINGKVRLKLVVPADLNPDALTARALADERLKSQLDGRQVIKVIAIPGRLVNVVVR